MNARALQQFQDGFARALLAPEPRPADYDPAIARLVAQPAFAVYRNTVMKGCIDALQANYASVARLVGEEWFRAAAAIFVRGNLPRHPTLADYGGGFADFLATFEPAAEFPYLPGVARLDRFWTEAHVAVDEKPVDAAVVARLAPEELARAVLTPLASARWAWFEQQPIVTLWRRNRIPGTGEEPVLDWHGEGALVLRPDGAVESFDIDQAGCAFLDACAHGLALEAAAAAALTVCPDTDFARLMATLLGAGAFADPLQEPTA